MDYPISCVYVNDLAEGKLIGPETSYSAGDIASEMEYFTVYFDKNELNIISISELLA